MILNKIGDFDSEVTVAPRYGAPKKALLAIDRQVMPQRGLLSMTKRFGGVGEALALPRHAKDWLDEALRQLASERVRLAAYPELLRS